MLSRGSLAEGISSLSPWDTFGLLTSEKWKLLLLGRFKPVCLDRFCSGKHTIQDTQEVVYAADGNTTQRRESGRGRTMSSRCVLCDVRARAWAWARA